MTDDDFNRMFGRHGEERPSFVERVVRQEPTPSVVAEAAFNALANADYRAFGFVPSGHVNASCELRWWMDGTAIPEGLAFPYRLLMEVGFSGEDTLRLLLPDKAVEIVGTRLEPLRQALMRQRATFLQQWSPLVWRAKPGQDAVIERIEIAR